MIQQEILCATDLTPASDVALRYAVLIGKGLGAPVTHLHILPKKERSEEARSAVEAAMRQQRDRCGAGGIEGSRLVEGEVIQGIGEETAKYSGFLVAGTHGPKGLRQSLLGADMLKLVRRSALPAIVVQEGYEVAPPASIVLPVAAHPDIHRLMDAVCALAKTFGAEVHLYQLARPNEEPSAELKANKERVIDRLQKEGIKWVHPVESSDVFSMGFAEPTIRYSQKVGAGLIAVMSQASDEYRYMADAEKERLLTNFARIPVLYA